MVESYRDQPGARVARADRQKVFCDCKYSRYISSIREFGPQAISRRFSSPGGRLRLYWLFNYNDTGLELNACGVIRWPHAGQAFFWARQSLPTHRSANVWKIEIENRIVLSCWTLVFSVKYDLHVVRRNMHKSVTASIEIGFLWPELKKAGWWAGGLADGM